MMPAARRDLDVTDGRDRGESLGKVILLVALLALAGWLAYRRAGQARVDWYLGSLRKNLGDEEAARGLAAMGDSAIPYLEREIHSPDADARLVTVIALASLETDGATRLLAEAAKDPDGVTAANAIAALGPRRGDVAARAVAGGLDDRRYGVRLAARAAAARETGLPWWAFGRPKKAEGKG
jgi:hypothetical protein